MNTIRTAVVGLLAAAAILVGISTNEAKASEDYMPYLLTGEALTAGFVFASYASLSAVAVTMIGGCEIRYKTTGQTCGTTPAPTPEMGYNQRMGLTPLADGTYYKK